MSTSPFTAKEILTADTPVFLFDCTMADASVQKWSSQTITISGHQYQGRVLKHNLFEAQVASDTQIGGSPKLSFELANADSYFSEVEQEVGFKGALLVVSSVFVNTTTSLAYHRRRRRISRPGKSTRSDYGIDFPAECDEPNVDAADAASRSERAASLSLAFSEHRGTTRGGRGLQSSKQIFVFSSLRLFGGSAGRRRKYECGVPYTSCALTRADCVSHGMFNSDSSGNTTGRFGGLEYVPATVLVRGAGQKSLQLSNVQDNQAAYNDPVPLVYGTQWHAPDVVFSRNDGNLTRMEVLLCMGQIEGVLTVLVDDIVIPQGVSGQNMTSTGWWNLISSGTRNGQQDPNFGDGGSGPIGDPYGSMAYLSIVVPNQINDGSSIPAVQVLIQGMLLLTFDTTGAPLGEAFSSNPAWVLLDILRRSAYTLEEINCASFATAAAYCEAGISVDDPIAGEVTVSRFECNFALKYQRSAGEIIRSLRNASRIYLVLNTAGLLEARIENTFALQQPTLPANSNSTEMFGGGWPAYEFDETSIARNNDGSANFKISSKGAQDTPNRLTVEFQDEFNQFQQDSFSLTDGNDSDLCGQIIAANWDAMGISNFSQASRTLLLALNRSIEGNLYIEFETSVKALGLLPGDLITVTYLKENFERTAFRVQKITPGPSFRTAIISAQLHNDLWYSDTVSSIIGGRGWAGQNSGVPSPVGGTVLDANGNLQLGITEAEITASDGSTDVELTVSFTEPSGNIGSLTAPLVSLVATVSSTGGTLEGGSTFFYALSTLDSGGGESPLSFIVQASTGAGSNTSSILLSGIALAGGRTAFNVYRGVTPQQLYRIATGQTPAASFTDTGLALQPILPPDPNFDHVDLFWRWVLVPEASATVHTSTTVGDGALNLAVNLYQSAIVRISRGTGAGQEQQITGNTATVISVAQPWIVEPDATSYFVVVENSWRTGNTGKSSPLTVDVPERIGASVQISARAANAAGDEKLHMNCRP